MQQPRDTAGARARWRHRPCAQIHTQRHPLCANAQRLQRGDDGRTGRRHTVGHAQGQRLARASAPLATAAIADGMQRHQFATGDVHHAGPTQQRGGSHRHQAAVAGEDRLDHIEWRAPMFTADGGDRPPPRALLANVVDGGARNIQLAGKGSWCRTNTCTSWWRAKPSMSVNITGITRRSPLRSTPPGTTRASFMRDRRARAAATVHTPVPSVAPQPQMTDAHRNARGPTPAWAVAARPATTGSPTPAHRPPATARPSRRYR